MTESNPYEVLGLPPDASHRDVVRTFARLAEHHYKEMAADSEARERFEAVKSAYETLTNYESRLRYSIEHGLPDPPKPGKNAEASGLLGSLGNLVPEQWPVLLPILFLIALRLVANHAIEIWQSLGSPTWGP